MSVGIIDVLEVVNVSYDKIHRLAVKFLIGKNTLAKREKSISVQHPSKGVKGRLISDVCSMPVRHKQNECHKKISESMPNRN